MLTETQQKQLNETFEAIVTGDRFHPDQLLLTQLDQTILESDEFMWYSKIRTAISNDEPLSIDEKISFLAMYRSFLQMVC